MNSPVFLVVNADDFGLSEGINRGIIQAARHGIVTSTSLMVRQPAAAHAVDLARDCPALSLGLHLDLGEWACKDGQWVELYSVVRTNDAPAVAQEIERQLAAFHNLTGRPPTHLDSHQHVHREEPVRSLLLAQARRLGVPLRECMAGIRYCGDFYGQDAEGQPMEGTLSISALRAILSALELGITEMACHPGFAQGLVSPYLAERELELQTLCDPSIRSTIDQQGIQLVSFSQLGSGIKSGHIRG